MDVLAPIRLSPCLPANTCRSLGRFKS
uniref:Uncharacterized protein n=1 Tax=Rhizophora mucronata TaxID=61149 RepID=A0A2P2PE72_RHIMU